MAAMVAVVVMATLSWADSAMAATAGLKPSEAPLVEVGQHYFGNTKHVGNVGGSGEEEGVDLWRLPALLTGDAITIAWHSENPRFCLAQDVDDYNWAENYRPDYSEPGEAGVNICNASTEYAVASTGSARSVVGVRSTTSDAFLEFLRWEGAYDFTIESIQHSIGVSLAATGEIQPTSNLTGSASLSSGAPVPDDLVFTLTASWATPGSGSSHQQTYTASSSGGNLSFPLSLPENTEGNKVSFTISRAADPGYLEAKSASLEIPVASPPPGIAVPSAQARVKHGSVLLSLACQGGGACNGNLRLIARFHLYRRAHKATIGRIGFSIAANQAAVVQVKLSQRGQRLLSQARRHRLRVHLIGQGVRARQVVLHEAAKAARQQRRSPRRVARQDWQASRLIARASSTKQQCMAKLLQPPRVTKAVMYHPGSHDDYGGVGGQEIIVYAAYSGVKGCHSWRRLGKYREQIKQSGHWVNLGGNFWYPSGTPSHENNQAHEVGFLGYPTNGIYDRCVHGHRQPARVQFRNDLKSVKTGKVVAVGKIENHTIRIESSGAC